MTDDKSHVREIALTARRSIPAEERATRAAAAAGRIAMLPEALNAKLVIGYRAMPDEIDPTPALETLRARGATIAYPRIAGKGALTLHIVRGEGDLETSTFGIVQPTLAAPNVDPADVDLAIIPGVAFDEFGGRLGMGGGYYDRLIPRMPRALLVGLAFDEQLMTGIPHEPHDIHMHVIVTPTQALPAPPRTHA